MGAPSLLWALRFAKSRWLDWSFSLTVMAGRFARRATRSRYALFVTNTPSKPSTKPAPKTKKAWQRALEPHDPLTSLVFTMPVFLVYHLGLLATDLRNGVDLVTGLMSRLLDASLLGYIALVLSFAVGLFFVARYLKRSHSVHPRELLPILAESVVWALLLAFSVGWMTQHLVGASLTEGAPLLQLGPRRLGPLEEVVMSAGAGFHEEVIFRVALFGGGAYALQKWGLPLAGSPRSKDNELRAGLIAAFVSSLLFSLVHYLGSLGDAFSLSSFVFRFLMGLCFVGLYRFRGFAVVVYTHTIYDLLVFFVFG